MFSELATCFAHSVPTEPAPTGPSLNHLLIAVSRGMDLLEGRPFRTGMRVAVIGGVIARKLKLPERTVAAVTYAGLVHDVGLAQVASDLLPHLPPGVNEKQIFKQHPLLDARIIGCPPGVSCSPALIHRLHQHPLMARPLLEGLQLSQDVIDIVAAHHEYEDGSGYPFGLSGDQIAIGAKILAFADVAEAVFSDVTGLITRRAALDTLMEVKAPGRFHRDVIDAFRAVLDEDEAFLKHLATLEMERILHDLLPERREPLGAAKLLSMIDCMGAWVDGLMPLYKHERTRTVAELALQLGNALGVAPEQAGELICAAMLMDIGHLGTPITLLLKDGPLSEEERTLMQDHAWHTGEVLRDIPGFDNVRLWAGEVHERLNGQGYPGRKKGHEISIGGRLLALVDVFEALTHRRPYRRQVYEPMDALPVIGQGRVSMYDTRLVSLLRQTVLKYDMVELGLNG